MARCCVGVMLCASVGAAGRAADGRCAGALAFIVTGSEDRTVRLWPTDPVGLARSLPLRALTSDEIAEIVAVSAAPPGPK